MRVRAGTNSLEGPGMRHTWVGRQSVRRARWVLRSAATILAVSGLWVASVASARASVSVNLLAARRAGHRGVLSDASCLRRANAVPVVGREGVVAGRPGADNGRRDQRNPTLTRGGEHYVSGDRCCGAGEVGKADVDARGAGGQRSVDRVRHGQGKICGIRVRAGRAGARRCGRDDRGRPYRADLPRRDRGDAVASRVRH